MSRRRSSSTNPLRQKLTPDSKPILRFGSEDEGMNKTRILLFGSLVAAAMIFGGFIGATVLAKSTLTPASAAAAAASPAPTFKSNETAAHEKTVAAARDSAH